MVEIHQGQRRQATLRHHELTPRSTAQSAPLERSAFHPGHLRHTLLCAGVLLSTLLTTAAESSTTIAKCTPEALMTFFLPGAKCISAFPRPLLM